MPSQRPHPETTAVLRNVLSLANRQNQQTPGPSGNSQLPPARRCISLLAGERDSSQGRSSIASTILGQNSTRSSSLNISRIADIPQHMTSTPSATQRRSIHTATATPSTPAHGGTSHTYSPCFVVSSPASSIASTPSSLSSLENLPTPTANADTRAVITNPQQTWATERNQRLRQWQLQPQEVSTPWSVVSGIRSIHQFGHSDMTHLVFATGRLLELQRWNRWPLLSASNLETISYATQRVREALAAAPHW